MAKSKETVVELYGMGTINKGAYLLLKSTIQELSKMPGEVVFCSELKSGGNSLSLAKEGVMQIPVVSRRTYLWNKVLLSLFPQRIRRGFGIVLDKEVDIIIDGSGFGYGDVWENSIDARYLGRVEKVKKKGGKVILLPQALGPFTKERTVSAFKEILRNADKIYARDMVSLKYAQEVNTNTDIISLAPDFTNLLLIDKPISESFSNRVCIVPNYKMIVHEKSIHQYFNFLKSLIDYLRKEKNIEPYFLVHEGVKDFDIAKAVNELISEPVEVVWPNDPLEAKELIKNARFAIVSRFHALVSALSQSVPVISTSWSHKYEMLMKDYGNERFIIGLEAESTNSLYSLVDELCDDKIRVEIKKSLNKYAAIEFSKARENWSEILSILSK
ncbi:polysaccharide pyruvyl transferase family protein [Neolewinella persica]|uniref:polysaccharide pyruvyl transferase family protein n=1 Tax=Neolewinella persica TaxID=70998 RepID=UPI000376A447|nr:polysaccharide pyruvyl transferase family protein [Neolewinella persica]